MANPLYLATLKLPLTEKPVTQFSVENQATYMDIFNLQNTFKIVLQNFTEEAPQDGKQYARKNGEWTEVTGGGGGGGIPEAPIDGKNYGRYNATWKEIKTSQGGVANLFLTGNLNTYDTNYRDYTVFVRLPASALLGIAPRWKFSMWLQATGSFSIGPMKLLKTAIGNAAVLESFDIKIGGATTAVITPPNSSLFRIEVDTIEVEMKADFDYHIAVYFPASNANNNNVGVMTSNSYVVGSYIAGNHTADSNAQVSGTSPLLVSNILAVA